MDSTKADFRNTFNTDHGQRTLGNMLIKGKFFSYVATPEEMAVQNFLKDILWDSECFPMFGKGNGSDITQFVDSLFKLKG